jgi:hypothetical protein
MKKRNISINTILLFILIAFFSNINAQNIYITKLNDLSFGEVFIGYSADIQHTDINAAKFSFYHTRWFRRNVYISFVLPTTLNNGVNQIPITFDQSQAAWSYSDQTSGRTNFDPHSVLKIRRLWFYRNVYLWLGGSIVTTSNLPYGLYSGTIILTVAY